MTSTSSPVPHTGHNLDISRFFEMDPLSMTTGNLDELIAIYRRKRSLFMESAKRPAGQPRQKKTSKKALGGLDIALDL